MVELAIPMGVMGLLLAISDAVDIVDRLALVFQSLHQCPATILSLWLSPSSLRFLGDPRGVHPVSVGERSLVQPPGFPIMCIRPVARVPLSSGGMAGNPVHTLHGPS